MLTVISSVLFVLLFFAAAIRFLFWAESEKRRHNKRVFRYCDDWNEAKRAGRPAPPIPPELQHDIYIGPDSVRGRIFK